MASEQPWFLKRVVAETDSIVPSFLLRKGGVYPSDHTVYAPHEGGFPMKKAVQKKSGVLPR
jgi:hypothetical protein